MSSSTACPFLPSSQDSEGEWPWLVLVSCLDGDLTLWEQRGEDGIASIAEIPAVAGRCCPGAALPRAKQTNSHGQNGSTRTKWIH